MSAFNSRELGECFVCAGPTRARKLALDRAIIELCEQCGHGRTTASATTASERVYGEGDAAREAYERKYLRAREAAYARGLDVLGAPDSGMLVDVGCGYGHFLRMAQSRGWRVRGSEPAPGQRAKALDEVRDSIVATVEDAVSTERPAVVTLWDSLEHMPDPRNELAMLAGFVEAGGFVLVRVPDARVFSAIVGRPVLRHLAALYLKLSHPTNPEEHPHHFTPTSLSRLAQQVGLVAVHEIDSKPDERVISSKFFGDAIARRALHRAGRDLPYEFTMLLEAPGG